MPYKDELKRRAAKREYNRRNKERINAYERERRAKNPASFRATKLRFRYGITHQEYSALYEKQKGLCALCVDRAAVDVDHDHITGKLRGLLCRSCNVGLGQLGDSLDGLRRAIAYLENSEG